MGSMAFPEHRSVASENFEIAKVLSIWMIVTGHFFSNTMLWVPSTVALFVFGFASSYFTHLKYRMTFQPGPYWLNKIPRLMLPLLVIDVFLLVLCSFRSSRPIWVWQTVPHLLGLGGALDWFGVENVSPLGRGMWFLTLLLVFYAGYPLLRIVNQSVVGSWTAMILSLLGVGYFQIEFPVGYSLWSTAFSFVFGAFVAERKPFTSTVFCMFGGIVTMSTLGLLNVVLKEHSYNHVLILATSVFVTLWLLKASLPMWLYRSTRVFSRMLLEIYLIHTYLFLAVTGSLAADYVLSLIVIAAVAAALRLLAGGISQVLAVSGR